MIFFHWIQRKALLSFPNKSIFWSALQKSLVWNGKYRLTRILIYKLIINLNYKSFIFFILVLLILPLPYTLELKKKNMYYNHFYQTSYFQIKYLKPDSPKTSVVTHKTLRFVADECFCLSIHIWVHNISKEEHKTFVLNLYHCLTKTVYRALNRTTTLEMRKSQIFETACPWQHAHMAIIVN